VRNGRKEEFGQFGFDKEVPDPQDEQTFTRSRIHWEKRNTSVYKDVLDWHTRLLKLRRELPALKNFNKNDLSANVISGQSMELIRTSTDKREKLVCLFNFSDREMNYESAIEGVKILDSTDKHPERIIAGTVCLLPESVVVYRQKDILG
jgi:maltooligosyltrehalose trehalohydrolase